MMLAKIFEYPPDPCCEQCAAILADSDCDLGDEVACLAVLRASRAEHGQCSLMSLRIAAHNIRTQRLIVSRSRLRLQERSDA